MRRVLGVFPMVYNGVLKGIKFGLFRGGELSISGVAFVLI
jgi:hypothetical protein